MMRLAESIILLYQELIVKSGFTAEILPKRCGGLPAEYQEILNYANTLTDIPQRHIQETLSVEPGVYRYRVEAKIPEGQSLVLSWDNPEEQVFRSVLANERVLQGEQSVFEGKITVTAKVEELRLKLICRGADIKLESLQVEKTGQLYLVGAICFLLVATGLNLLLYLRRLAEEKRITGSQQGAVWALIGVVGVAAFPNLTDYITVSGNTIEYLTGGKNIFLLIPALFRAFGFTLKTSWQLFVWIVTIFTTVGTYVCLRHTYEDWEVALLGTVLYMLMPYRGYCFYVLGDVDTWLGMSFLPWLVCGLVKVLVRTVRLQKEKKNSGVLLGGIVWLFADPTAGSEMPIVNIVPR